MRKGRRAVHKSPVISKLYHYTDKKMRKVAEYRTSLGLEKRLSLFAEVMPEERIYVSLLGEWYRVEFDQKRNEHGTLVEYGWELKKSDGVKE